MANFDKKAKFTIECPFILLEWKESLRLCLFLGNDFGTV